jgi:hypothetical protein
MIHSIQLDYVNREAIIKLDVWVGDLNSGDENLRDKYQSGQLILSDLLYCVIEPPDNTYQYHKASPLWVDAGPIEKLSTNPSVPLPSPIPADSFGYYFYVQDWNAGFYIAAKSALLKWVNEDKKGT